MTGSVIGFLVGLSLGMLRALRKAGWSMGKLGLEFHCTAERVGEIMRKEGIA